MRHGATPRIGSVEPLAAILGVLVVVAVCLWLLFRSGSMAHRTERDDALGLAPPDPDEHPGATEG